MKNELINSPTQLLNSTNMNEYKVGGVSALNLYNKLMRNKGSTGFLCVDVFSSVIPKYLFDIESGPIKSIIVDAFYALDDILYEFSCIKNYSWKKDEFKTDTKNIDNSYKVLLATDVILKVLDVSKQGYSENHYYPMMDRPIHNLAIVIYKALSDSDIYEENEQLNRAYISLSKIFNYQEVKNATKNK